MITAQTTTQPVKFVRTTKAYDNRYKKWKAELCDADGNTTLDREVVIVTYRGETLRLVLWNKYQTARSTYVPLKDDNTVKNELSYELKTLLKHKNDFRRDVDRLSQLATKNGMSVSEYRKFIQHQMSKAFDAALASVTICEA